MHQCMSTSIAILILTGATLAQAQTAPKNLKPGVPSCVKIAPGHRQCYYVPEGAANNSVPHKFTAPADFTAGHDHWFGDGHISILVGEYDNYPQVPLDHCVDHPVDISGNTTGSSTATCTKVLKAGLLYLIDVTAGATPGTGYVNHDPQIEPL